MACLQPGEGRAEVSVPPLCCVGGTQDKVWGTETQTGRENGQMRVVSSDSVASWADAQGRDTQRDGAGGRANSGPGTPEITQGAGCPQSFLEANSPFSEANEGKMRNVQRKEYFDWHAECCHSNKRGRVTWPLSAGGGGQPGRSHLGQDWPHPPLSVPLLC